MIVEVNSDINQAIFKVNYKRFLHNAYTEDYNNAPTVSANGYNTQLYFISNEAGSVTVDWGDGQIEKDIPLVKSSNDNYVVSWRSLAVDYYKNPDDATKGWGLGNDASGNPIIPRENHIYTDGQDVERIIKMDFTCNVIQIRSFSNILDGFPTLEFSKLENLTISQAYNIQEIKIEDVVKLQNLKGLSLEYLDRNNRIQGFPTAITTLTGLTSLSMNGVLNLAQETHESMQKIEALSELTSLNLLNCNVLKYFKVFNDLKNLKTLHISSAMNPDVSPNFDDVAQINQNVNNFMFMSASWISSRTNWSPQIKGKGISKLVWLHNRQNGKITTDVPDYLLEMTSLNSLQIGNSYTTQARIDAFVTSYYNLVKNNSSLPQFQGMQIIAYEPSSANQNPQPSGVYQASSTPSTPMEMIYYLVQMGQTWVLKNGTETRKAIPEGYYLDDSVIYAKDGVIKNNELKPIEYENNND